MRIFLMEKIKYFFECYYHMNQGLDQLDAVLEEFKTCEPKESRLQLISELKPIIEGGLYEKASYFLKRHGNRRLSFKKTELLLRYIYNKLCNIPSEITLADLKRR